MTERGEFRAIMTVIVDGPDYQSLSPKARLTLLTVKLSLGPSGIDVIPGLKAALSERTGLSPSVLEAALGELVRAGWVQVERNVCWVIDGLKFEPALNVRNENHRKSIFKHLNGLPRLAIVGAFVRHYTDWFPPGNAMPMAFECHSNAMPMPSPCLADQEEGKKDEVSGIKETTPSSARETPAPASVREEPTTPTGYADARAGAIVATFLAQVPAKQRVTWRGEVNGWLEGLNLPRNEPATESDVATALSDYLAQPAPDFNRLHVRSFVARQVRERQRAPPSGNGKPRTGKLPADPRTEAYGRLLEGKNAGED